MWKYTRTKPGANLQMLTNLFSASKFKWQTDVEVDPDKAGC